MYLIIVFLALCFRPIVSSEPEKVVPSANTTNILFNRATNPTYAIDASCSRFPNTRGIVNDWLETAQVTSRRINLGSGDPHFQYAFKTVFGTSQDNPEVYDFWQLEKPVTAFTFVKCMSKLAHIQGYIQTVVQSVLIIHRGYEQYCIPDSSHESICQG